MPARAALVDAAVLEARQARQALGPAVELQDAAELAELAARQARRAQEPEAEPLDAAEPAELAEPEPEAPGLAARAER